MLRTTTLAVIVNVCLLNALPAPAEENPNVVLIICDDLKPKRTAATKADPNQDTEAWKDKYFAKHPAADANKDGKLTWPEYKAYRAKFDPPQPESQPPKKGTENGTVTKSDPGNRLQTSGIFTQRNEGLIFTDSADNSIYSVIDSLAEKVARHLDKPVKIVARTKPTKSGTAMLMVHIVDVKTAAKFPRPVASQALPRGSGAHHAPPGNYVVSWQDKFSEFNSKNWSRGLECDSSAAHIIWNKATGGKHLLNDKYCSYITDEDAYVENGHLVLRNQKRPYAGESPSRQFEYTSGWVNSMNKRFVNGTKKGVYIEIRAQFPSGLKVWPAIWMVAEKPHWPPEIDIWEYFGHYWDGNDKMYMRCFYPKTSKERWKKGNHDDSSVPIEHFDRDYDCEEWHTYGFQWTAEKMVWSIDNKVVRTLEKSSLPDYWPDEDLCFVLNNSVATEPADEDTTWPNYLVIDYITVYEEE